MKQIYFDNAASSYPKPERVYNETFDFVRQNGANCGRSSHALAMEAAEKAFAARCTIAEFVGFNQPENIIFTLNATMALNIVIFGLLRPGDHVITTDLEHNSVLRPLYAMQNRGVKLDIVSVDLYDDTVTLERIRQKIRPDTRAIIVTQCSNVCGKIMPIYEISKLKSDRIRLVVDGSQGAGSVPTNFEKMGMDYYCATSHKSLLGLQGSGFIVCRYKELTPLLYGGTGGETFRRDQPDFLPDRLEAGTLSLPSIISMAAGIRFLNKVGMENVFRHKTELVDRLYCGLNQINGILTCAEYDKMISPGVLSFTVDGYSSESVGEYLARNNVAVRDGMHCAPLFHQRMGTEDGGMVRVSLGYANTVTQIDTFLHLMKDFCK